MSPGFRAPAGLRAGVFLALGLIGLAGLAFSVARRAISRSSNERLDAGSQAAVARGRDALQRGRPVAAIRAVSAVPPGDPAEPDALSVKGLALVALDRVEEARGVLERSWRMRPNQPMVAKVLAAIYLSASESARGLTMLRAAAELDPNDFRPWYGMGDAYRLMDRQEDAARGFREALQRRPDFHEARVGLADALLKLGRTADAAPAIAEALRERPDDPEVLILAARQARAEGRAPDEARFLAQILAVNPDHREALVLRAQAEQRAGELNKALADAERAVALLPTDQAALHLLSSIEAALGLKERAAGTNARRQKLAECATRMQALTREIDAHPNDPEPHWRLGQVAAEAGMTTLAVQSFRAALALDPRCQPARQGLLAINAARDETPKVPAPSSR